MVTAKERIEQLKRRVEEKEGNALMVDQEGGLWLQDEADKRNVKGKDVMPFTHGRRNDNSMV